MNVLWMGSKIHLITVTNSILLLKSRSPTQETRASDNCLSDNSLPGVTRCPWVICPLNEVEGPPADAGGPSLVVQG
jgi:hypothetical protein